MTGYGKQTTGLCQLHLPDSLWEDLKNRKTKNGRALCFCGFGISEGDFPPAMAL
jgi:hypothetical protein